MILLRLYGQKDVGQNIRYFSAHNVAGSKTSYRQWRTRELLSQTRQRPVKYYEVEEH